MIATSLTSAHAALELRDYAVKASGESQSVALTVSHFKLLDHLGNRLPRPGYVYLVLSAQWRNKLPPEQGQKNIDVQMSSDRLLLLFNGDRRAVVDGDSKQILIATKDPSLTPIDLGDVNIPAAKGIVAGDYVFELPAYGVQALDLVYVSDKGSIRVPLQSGSAEAIPNPIGTSAKLADLEFSLISARVTGVVGGQQSARGQEYMVLDLLLSDRSPAKPAMVWDNFVLRDAHGTEYHLDDNRGLENPLNGPVRLAPGLSVRGTLKFHIPSDHYALSFVVKGDNNAIAQIPIPESGPAAPTDDSALFALKSDDGVTISAFGASRATTIGTLTPSGLNEFEILELLATSESDKQVQLKLNQFALTFGDTSIAPTNVAAYAVPAPLDGQASVPAHGKLYFGLTFEVPPNAKELTLQYKEADGIALQHALPQAVAPQAGSTAPVPSGTNLVSPDIGGEIERMTNNYGAGYSGRNLLVANAPSWVPGNGVAFPFDIVLSFYKRSPALISAVVATLADDASIAPRQVEVWTSMTGPNTGFGKVAGVTIDPRVRDQVITFAPITARFVRFRIVSGYSRFGLGLSKLKVIEGSQAGYTPLLKQNPQIADWKYTPRRSAQLGIDFLQPFTVKWQAEHSCYGCHIHAQTLMGLAIASHNNYVVSPDLIADTTDFLEDKQRPEGIISDAEFVAGTQFAAMALAYVEGDDAKVPDPYLLRAVDWLITQQKPSGEIPMDRNAPPICQGTIMSTANAVTAFMRAYGESKADKYKNAADRGLAFIAGAKPANTQDEIFTVIALTRYGKSEQRALIDNLVARLKSEQLADGGWRETPQISGSNAFATGQVLYAFKTAGVPIDSPEFKRGVIYLVKTQEPDGSWPAENTQSGPKTVDAPTMWAVIGLAGSFDGKVPEPNVQRDEEQIECEKVKKLAAMLDKDGKIILHVNFDFDKATLRPDALPTIDRIAKLLKEYPSLHLEVDGHTDNIGTAKKNLVLSRQRADTVVRALVAQGIDAKRLSAAGFGLSRPVATNKTPEGRFQNRRVELVRESSTGELASNGACGAVLGAAPTPSPAQVASAASNTVPVPSPPPPRAAEQTSASEAPARSSIQTAKAEVPRKLPPAIHPEPELESADARLQLTEDAWVFSAPSDSSSHVARVHAEKYVMVTGATTDYVQVRLRSGKTGFVPSAAVRLVEPADTVSNVLHDAPVYEKPSRHSKRVARVHAPGRVHVIGHALNYTEVRMRSGVEGFVPNNAFN